MVTLIRRLCSVLPPHRHAVTLVPTGQLTAAAACCDHIFTRFFSCSADPGLSVAPTKLGGFDLDFPRRRSWLIVAQPALNRSRSLWGDDAGEFRPERFDRDGLSFNLIQSKAFGCPGNAAARLTGPLGIRLGLRHSVPEGYSRCA